MALGTRSGRPGGSVVLDDISRALNAWDMSASMSLSSWVNRAATTFFLPDAR
jgi:hypothetical protein